MYIHAFFFPKLTYSSEAIKQTFIKVVRDSAPILYFSDHVPNSTPRHALY